MQQTPLVIPSAATRTSPLLRAVLASLGIGLAAGCQVRGPERVTVPISNWPGYEYFFLAREQGLDRQEQLDLSLREFPDPQDIVHAYLRGELPMAQLTTVEAVDLCARVPQRCPVVVLVLDESLGADQLVVRNAIPSIAALRQRAVAVTPSTLGPYVLSRALEKHGLAMEDVQIRPMPLNAMAASLRRGEVDAAALFPPFSEEAVRGGQARPLFSSREIPGEILDVLVVDPAFLAARPRTISRLLRVWQRAHTYAEQHPEVAIPLMARREGLSSEEFRRALSSLRFQSLSRQRSLFQPGGPLQQNLKALRRVQVKLGLLKASSSLPGVSGGPLDLALRP